MEVHVFHDHNELSRYAADLIEDQVKGKADTVLGIATGSTPLKTYANLTDDVKAGKVDFSKVTTFNLDEYYPILHTDPNSYYDYTRKNFADGVHIEESRMHIPNGEAADPAKEAADYEKAIKNMGGIDLQILGLGENGHIGFNEPEVDLYAATHLTALTESTLHANSRFFESIASMPKHALTMGMATIFSARKILMLASGKNKRAAVEKILSDRISTSCPATFLKLHPNFILACDEEAMPEQFQE